MEPGRQPPSADAVQRAETSNPSECDPLPRVCVWPRVCARAELLRCRESSGDGPSTRATAVFAVAILQGFRDSMKETEDSTSSDGSTRYQEAAGAIDTKRSGPAPIRLCGRRVDPRVLALGVVAVVLLVVVLSVGSADDDGDADFDGSVPVLVAPASASPSSAGVPAPGPAPAPAPPAPPGPAGARAPALVLAHPPRAVVLRAGA